MKINANTQVWTAGHNTAGYSPDPEHVAVFATADEARAYVADEIDRLADSLADDPFIGDDESGLWSVAAATASLVKTDPDLDYRGEFSIYVEDGRALPTAFWVQLSTLGDVYGDTADEDLDDDYIELLQDLSAL